MFFYALLCTLRAKKNFHVILQANQPNQWLRAKSKLIGIVYMSSADLPQEEHPSGVNYARTTDLHYVVRTASNTLLNQIS